MCIYVQIHSYFHSHIYFSIYWILFLSLRCSSLSFLLPASTISTNSLLGSVFVMSLHICWVYCCFVGMNFNVCKWLCFLHLVLFLPSVTLHCIVHIPPSSWRVSVTSNCRLTTLLHLPSGAMRDPQEHPFTTCEGPGRWTTKKHLGCWHFSLKNKWVSVF